MSDKPVTENQIEALLETYSSFLEKCSDCDEQNRPTGCQTCKGFGFLPNMSGFKMLILIKMAEQMSFDESNYRFVWDDDGTQVQIV